MTSNALRGAALWLVLPTLTAQAQQPAPVPTAAGAAAPRVAQAAPAVSTAPLTPQPAAGTPVAEQVDSGPPPIDAVAPSDIVAPAFDLLPLTGDGAGGLSGDAVAARAVEVSPRTKLADATLGNARRRSGRAYSVFVPRLDLSAGYRRLSEVDIPEQLEAFMPAIFNTYSVRATLRVAASDYFLTLGDYYDSAKQLEVVANHQRDAEIQAVAYEARREYLQLARAVAATTLSRHRIAQLGHFSDEIRVLVEGGEVGSVNLGQAKVRLAAAKAVARADEASQRIAEQALRRRLQLPADSPVGIAEPLTRQVPAVPTDLPALVAQAQAQRPEALALQALASAHGHRRDAVEMERYPTVALVGDVNMDNPNQRVIPVKDKFNTTWSAGVEIRWSPSDLATKDDALDDASLEVIRAEQQLRSLRDRIVLEVSGAYENALAATDTVQTLQASVEAAEETLRIRTALFRSGEATSREVLDAELDLRQAQLQWVDAALSVHLAMAALSHATGAALSRH